MGNEFRYGKDRIGWELYNSLYRKGDIDGDSAG